MRVRLNPTYTLRKKKEKEKDLLVFLPNNKKQSSQSICHKFKSKNLNYISLN